MTLSPTFNRRFQSAALLEQGGRLAEALEAYSAVFDPLPDPSERRVASAEFCIQVELKKAAVLVRLCRADDALELLERDWMWRLVNEVNEDARTAFFNAYGQTRTTAGTPWKAEPAAILKKLSDSAVGPHRLHGWDAFLRRFPN
jgi:hypothetical protein